MNSDVAARKPPHWSHAKRIAFRLAFAIAALSAFRFAIFIPGHLVFDALRQPVASVVNRGDQLEWQTTTAIGAFLQSRLTGGTVPVRDMLAGFRTDRTSSALPYMVGLLATASVIAIVWTLMDRRRPSYVTLNRWMRVYLRFALGTAMLTYVFIKVIPTQFGFLTPGELLRPIGQLSRFQLLWDFMATSPGYTVFTGLIELFGTTLLFFRRTTLLGSLVLAGALTNVVAMDLAYRVGAVYYATGFLLVDTLILAPYLGPLSNILLGRGGELPEEPSALRPRWYHSPVAKAALICALALPLVQINLGRSALRARFLSGEHLFYGLFNVTAFVRNGQSITPLASDGATWKRVGGDSIGSVRVQFANGEMRQFQLADDLVQHVWTIRDADPARSATLHYAVRQGGDVFLDGRLGSDSVNMVLHPVDIRTAFPLLGPG